MPDAKTCLICGDEFSGHHRARYCSSACRAERDRKRAAAYYEEHKDEPALKARVRKSSRDKYERIKNDPVALEAHRAATRRWRAANPEATAEQYRQWRMTNPDAVRTKVQRRRARLLDAFVEDVDPRVIWERDGGACGLCGLTVDPSLAWPDRMSKTLDHVVPLSKGGKHEASNLQLAHAVCNSRKNNRVSGEIAVNAKQAE